MPASIAAVRGLGSYGLQAQLSHGIWDLPGPGIEPESSCTGRQILCHSVTREARIIKAFISVPMKVLLSFPLNFFIDTLVIQVYVIYLPHGWVNFQKFLLLLMANFCCILLLFGWSCSIDDQLLIVVLSKSSIFLMVCLVVLCIVENGILKSLGIIVKLCIF